jgi:TPR repeat protein
LNVRQLIPLLMLALAAAIAAPGDAWSQQRDSESELREMDRALQRDTDRSTPQAVGAMDPTSAQARLYQATSDQANAYMSACRARDAAGCVALSNLVLDSAKPLVLEGSSRTSIAADYLELACALDVAEGCLRAAGVIEGDAVLNTNPARLDLLLRRGCALRAVNACSLFGARHFEGAGGPDSPDEAIRYLELGCRGGDTAVCTPTAQMLVAGADGVAADPVRGAALYAVGCDGNDAVACYNLAIMQLRGRGIARDEEAGIAQLRRAHALDPELAPAADALRRRGLLQ